MAANDTINDPYFNLEARRYYSLIDISYYAAQTNGLTFSDWSDVRDHYNSVGWKEGWDPSSLFDTTAYLSANPDVAALNVSPLKHYVETGMAEFRGFGGIVDENSGYIFEIADNVPEEQVLFIKQGLAQVETFFDEYLGGKIPTIIQNKITVKIEATGIGNQEIYGGGGSGTAFSAKNDLLPRPYFDVLTSNPGVYWAQDTALRIVAHEYAHSWQLFLGAASIYTQPLGNWIQEGLAEYIAYSVAIKSGSITKEQSLDRQANAALQSGELSQELENFGSSSTPVWVGHVGHLAIDWLVSESPNGILSLKILSDRMAAGDTTAEAFKVAFDIALPDFYTQFEVWRPLISANPDTAMSERPDLINISDDLKNDNQLIGTDLDDVIDAKGGDDTITGAGGNDTIDGGAGTDTAIYAGDAKHFSITFNKGAATSVQDRKGTEGTDSLTSIENIDFQTGTKDVNLDVLDGVVNVSSADLSAFIEMYIAYFNRAPDAEGLFYWGTRLSQGMSKEQIAESFYVQPETKALYNSFTDTGSFVTAVYQNFLGRGADADGFNYWVKQLDDGAISKPIFLLAIINGAKASTGSQADVDYFTNKANIGAYFSVIKGMSNTDNAKAAMALYNGSAASITAAKNAIDGYYAAAQDATSGELLINLVGVMDDPFVA